MLFSNASNLLMHILDGPSTPCVYTATIYDLSVSAQWHQTLVARLSRPIQIIMLLNVLTIKCKWSAFGNGNGRCCQWIYIGPAAKSSCIVFALYTCRRDIIILIAVFIKIASVLKYFSDSVFYI